jgi:hypothetical protein
MDYKMLAQMLMQGASPVQQAGDVVKFGRKTPQRGEVPGIPEVGPMGGGSVTPMPGARRPPLFPEYEASKGRAPEALKFELQARAQREWKSNPVLQKTYKTPQELYQMYLALHGVK